MLAEFATQISGYILYKQRKFHVAGVNLAVFHRGYTDCITSTGKKENHWHTVNPANNFSDEGIKKILW